MERQSEPSAIAFKGEVHSIVSRMESITTKSRMHGFPFVTRHITVLPGTDANKMISSTYRRESCPKDRMDLNTYYPISLMTRMKLFTS